HDGASTMPAFRQMRRGAQFVPYVGVADSPAMWHATSTQVSRHQLIQFLIDACETFGQVRLQSPEDLLNAVIEARFDQARCARPRLLECSALFVDVLPQAP